MGEFEGKPRFEKYAPQDDSRDASPQDEYPKIWFDERRKRSSFFTGRQEISQQILPSLNSDQHAVALIGRNGVGKTEIALQYAVRKRNQYKDGGFVFLNATSPETLEKSSQKFFEELSVRDKVKYEDADVLDWVNKNEHLLALLDNTTDPELVGKFTSGSKNHILVTSPTPIAGIENLTVEPLEQELRSRTIRQ